jgi:uncharacterized protein (DUF2336 family)
MAVTEATRRLTLSTSTVRDVIDQLECSLQGSPSSERLKMLRSVTNLYLDGAATHSQEHVELFDQALNQLIDYVETQALARLSAQLAPIETAPLRVVQRLARHDDITVSEPLLRESKRLSTNDLIEIANTKSQAHLASIGRRSDVDEAVTDILVERGDTHVARVIAANPGARFSKTGFSNLVTRAETEIGLAEIVAIRSEMTPDHFRQLMTRATDTVRRRLTSISDPRTHAKIKRVIDQIAREIDRASAPPERDYSAAQDLLAPMRDDTDRLRSMLAEFAARQKFEETIVALAILGDLNPIVVEKIMMKSDEGGILLICRGIDLDWPTTRAILSLCPAGSAATDTTESFARFEKLTVSTARRVLRFWQVRTSVAAQAAS